MRWPRALALLSAAALEDVAAHLSERAKSLPQRAFYRGYEQGVRDGRDGAEHALKWLAGKETK